MTATPTPEERQQAAVAFRSLLHEALGDPYDDDDESVTVAELIKRIADRNAEPYRTGNLDAGHGGGLVIR